MYSSKKEHPRFVCFVLDSNKITECDEKGMIVREFKRKPPRNRKAYKDSFKKLKLLTKKQAVPIQQVCKSNESDPNEKLFQIFEPTDSIMELLSNNAISLVLDQNSQPVEIQDDNFFTEPLQEIYFPNFYNEK